MSRKPSVRGLIDHVVGDPTVGRLEALLTTTFDLEPDFVERDFLPSLLRLPALDDFSHRGRMQLEVELGRLHAAAFLVEARRYQGRPRSLRLHVSAARLPSAGVLHAKVTLAVYEGAVRLAVGSANLTAAGYRHNREVALVIEANTRRGSEAKLLQRTLAPMRDRLRPWWSDDAERALSIAETRLNPWAQGATADDDATFLWSGADDPLVARFVAMWPRGERVRRIRIVSPFWSEATDDGPLPLLLRALRKRGAEVEGAAVTLVCAAAPDTVTTWAPALPASYAAYDFGELGVNVEAIAARPGVDVEEGGSDRVQVERRLHAKVLIVDGPSTSLAYLGSANFSLPGWGFIAGADANIEAGVALRAGARNDPFGSLVPPVTGNPVKLEGDGRARIHASTPEEPEQTIPWPSFLLRAELRASGRDGALELTLELDLARSPRSWSVALDEHTAPLEVSGAPESATRGAGLSPEALSALIRSQTVHVRWDACELGVAYPINVPPAVRARLPLGDPNQRPGEGELLAFFQGRLALEDVFPPPPEEAPPRGGSSADASASAVDTSRILAYQVRSFVEALPGVRGELVRSAVSEPSIRFAALGPVSPVALAREVVRAVDAGRSGVAAGFQLAELARCIDEARSAEVPNGLRSVWGEVLDDARGEVVAMLRALRAGDASLAKGTRFGDYCVEMLGAKEGRP